PARRWPRRRANWESRSGCRRGSRSRGWDNGVERSSRVGYQKMHTDRETPTGVMARLMAELGKLPGIGPKTAERLTHHLLAARRDEVMALADALRALKDQIRRCSVCCAPTEHERCELCSDSRRDPSLICVVEQPRDLTALQRAGGYRGLYHVLH